MKNKKLLGTALPSLSSPFSHLIREHHGITLSIQIQSKFRLKSLLCRASTLGAKLKRSLLSGLESPTFWRVYRGKWGIEHTKKKKKNHTLFPDKLGNFQRKTTQHSLLFLKLCEIKSIFSSSQSTQGCKTGMRLGVWQFKLFSFQKILNSEQNTCTL